MSTGLEEVLNRLLCASDASFKQFLNGPEGKLKPFVEALLLASSQMAYSTEDLSNFEPTGSTLLCFLCRLCPQRSPKKAKQLNAAIAPKRFVDLFFGGNLDYLSLLLWLWRMRRRNVECVDQIKAELVPLCVVKSVAGSLPSSDPEISSFVNWLRGVVSGAGASVAERGAVLNRFEFDSDDDLVDEDESSAVETTSARKTDLILLGEYVKDATIFARTLAVRRSKARAALLQRAEMSHEQLEGWAIMFERNPRKQRILSDFALNMVK